MKIKCLNEFDIKPPICYIYIFDKNNKLLFNSYTNKMGILEFNPPYIGIYKIIIVLRNKKICKIYYLNNTDICIKLKKSSLVKIILKDNYGIEIKKGMINLWTNTQ